MSIPKTVIIGAQVFDIKETTRKHDGMLNEGNYGYTQDDRNLIVIDADLHISKKRLTVLHEVLHAARMAWDNSVKPRKGDDFDTWEHYFIGIYESSILLILRDNPDLLDWLLEE